MSGVISKTTPVPTPSPFPPSQGASPVPSDPFSVVSWPHLLFSMGPWLLEGGLRKWGLLIDPPPQQGLPTWRRSEPQAWEQPVTPWDSVFTEGDISGHLGWVVAMAFSSPLCDSWFRSISAGPLGCSGVLGLLGASEG